VLTFSCGVWVIRGSSTYSSNDCTHKVHGNKQPFSGTYICSCVSRYFASTCSSLSSVSPAPLLPNLPPTPGVRAPNHVQEACCENTDKYNRHRSVT
jgi:hypothetical protein